MLELVKVDRFVRRTKCGRVSLELMREGDRRVFKWSFVFPPFMGTKFDFIAFRRPSPCVAYDKRQRNNQRLRARRLFDAVEDDLGAEVGLIRKPKPLGVYTPPKHKPGKGTTVYELRDVLETRFGAPGATSICAAVFPGRDFKKLKADELFECLYAERWAAAYGRSLLDWGGMVKGEIAPRLDLPYTKNPQPEG